MEKYKNLLLGTVTTMIVNQITYTTVTVVQSVLFRVFAECDALENGVRHRQAVKTNRGRKVLF